jgi:amino acid adenylation domain-containing protein
MNMNTMESGRPTRMVRQAGPDTPGSGVAGGAAGSVGFAASFAQERLWFLHQVGLVGPAYHIPSALRMQGDLNIPALRAAFETLIARHESLRTRFAEVAGSAVQVIDAAVDFQLQCEDLSQLQVSVKYAALEKAIRAEAQKLFSLLDGPLFRAMLLKLAARDHVLLVTMHHIVSDGWSVGILTREIAALYNGAVRGEPVELPELEIQYADYAAWQRGWLQGEVLEEQLAYWRGQLGDAPPTLELPIDRPRPAVESFRGDGVGFNISAPLAAKLTALCRSERATDFMGILAVFQVLLSRWSGEDDLVVGSTIAGRSQRATENLIGFFVNLLPFRSRLGDEMSFRQFLQQVRETALQAYSHQDLPFEKLVAALRPERNLAHHPLFQVLFSFATASPSQDSLQLDGLRLDSIEHEGIAAKFDLSLGVDQSTNGLSCAFEFATDLFDRVTIERLATHFCVLVEGLVHNPDALLRDLPLMRQGERDRIVVNWNRTARDFGPPQCVHDLFTAQAARTPAALALLCGEQRLSYMDLDHRTNQLAHHLIALGVGPEVIVAVRLERGVEMVVALMAVLKAGGAYLPVDPLCPQERLQQMLVDARAKVLLTHASMLSSLEVDDVAPLALDRDWPQIAQSSADPIAPRARATNLAYAIFTSGSTGQPKGAMNEHRGVVNRLLWMQERYRLDTSDRVLQKTPYTFDVSVWEFFWTLMSGACLVIAHPDGHKDPGYLHELIDETGVTTLHFVPSMLQSFLDHRISGSCPSLRHVVCSGEELPAASQAKCFERFPTVRLSNLYGPTEAAVDVTSWECTGHDTRARVPIGRPISNIAIYVLDRFWEPVPVGVAGELFIGGIGVARGYLNRPGLTAQRFVASPFFGGERLYRTGDKVRYLADGNLEYLGRLDKQVKIRGHRIEPGEVEAALMVHQAISQAVVVAREDEPGDQRLVAYVVAAMDASIPQPDILRMYLQRTLPDYMVPSTFVTLDRLPLTSSGKLDRSALPAPQGRADLTQTYVAPRTPAEQLLAEIWVDVLRVDRVGIHDNFFELGGHSLLTMRIIARIHERFNVSLPVWTLFESPTVALLATHLLAPAGDDVLPDGQPEEMFEEGVM